MIKKQDVKFHGEVIKRVLIVFPQTTGKTYNHQQYTFLETRFNSVRNYREYSHPQNLEKILEATSDNLPRITYLKEDDACLLIGNGRFIDKASYEFAKKCFLRNIPVYFLKANTKEDSNILVVNSPTRKACYQAPSKYFMQIQSLHEIELSRWTTDLYALLPGMVPM